MFINTIHNNDTEVITRNYINITFVCRYPINYMVQQPNGENMIRVDVRLVFYLNKIQFLFYFIHNRFMVLLTARQTQGPNKALQTKIYTQLKINK